MDAKDRLGLKPTPLHDVAMDPHDLDSIKNKGVDDAVPLPPIDRRPQPQLHLSRWRFALTVTVSIAVLIGLLTIFLHGVVIDRNVLDDLGSTKNVEGKVGTYQAINGFVTAAIGMVMESYFAVFIVVAATFLSNVRWYPGDDPHGEQSRVKRLCLWAFEPMVVFVLNVAITAAFVSHKTTGVERVFLQSDLAATTALSVNSLNATNAANLTTLGNNVSVLDSVLRGAVLGQVAPFEMLLDSPCVLANASATTVLSTPTQLPPVKEVRSTAVVYGFPTQDWNIDAMPFGLVPTHSLNFPLADVNATLDTLTAKFDAFQKASNVTWLTAYELFLQGKLLFERSISDSNVSASYPCVWVDGKTELESSDSSASSSGGDAKANATATTNSTAARRRRRSLQDTAGSRAAGEVGDDTDDYDDASDQEDIDDLDSYFDTFDDGPYKGLRRCYGAVSSLDDLANMTDPSMHTIDAFVTAMVDGFVRTIPEISPEEMNLTIETFDVNPQMQLTAMTIDMPYLADTAYRNTDEYCDGDVLKPDVVKELGNDTDADELAMYAFVFCNQTSYPYIEPRAACGHANCVFLDKSGTLAFKKQLQLMPYLQNCSTAQLKYSADYLNFFPTGCVAQRNAVFLYGLGSYMAGESFDAGDADNYPYLLAPRRHVVLSFAKLEWKMEDLNPKFQAECGVNATTTATSRCAGLLHNLENVTVPVLDATPLKEKCLRVLLLGSDHLPADLDGRDFRNPVQLVSLNARPFYYAADDRYYEWEYIDKARFTSTNWTTGLTSDRCSPLVDSYITQLEKNHFYIDRPLQPLYTSALFYLFQDAAVKSIKLTKNATTGVEVLELSVVGTTALKGDLEKHEIKFSIPLLSLLSTFIGLGFLLLLAVMAVVCPTQRLKMSHDTSVAVQYAHVLKNDQYPSEVFDRAFRLPTGERVPMDECVVDSVTLHHARDEDKKVFL